MTKTEETPNPGTKEAIEQGCTCPVLDNAHGKGWHGIEGLFVYSCGCSVHYEGGELVPTSRNETEAAA